MKVFKEKLVKTEIDRICDVCDESVSIKINGILFVERGELHAEFGYGSNGEDGKVYHLDLCEACFKTALQTLKEHRRNLGKSDANLQDDHFGLDETKSTLF
ncbi:hypothetical protein BCT65_018110 [Vibrio splendidus]|uniref:hypothetical protein n=1 Tax=Vibrio splendidus TaxID=29497 RepID=UPI000C83EA32|nr:hypothetical protein [Vibrio splendidus]MCC5518956.1 hypothetical protein [Vibrio splendidus]